MFGGVRDSRWTHVLIEGGGRAEAAPYLPEARKLLGAVRGTSETTGLGVVIRRQALEDGTELEARVIGRIPHVTIRLKPPGGGEDERVVLDGFLVWPRDAAAPDGPFEEGDPPTFPQQVLSPPSTRLRQRRWYTFAYDRFTNFWRAIRGAKEIYRRRRGVDLLPDGLRYYGNHHWRSPRGVVVSWHGPESGAIVNGARPHYFEPDGAGGMTATFAPGLQHGVHVFHFGKVLVNVLDWPTDYQRVGGACVREDDEGQLWLYVAQFKLPDFREIAVYRYRLIRGLARPGFDEVQVDAGNPDERELVWAQALPLSPTAFAGAWDPAGRWGAYAHPARFSASGRKLLVYVPGREPYTWTPPGGAALTRTVYADADARIEFDVDTGAATVTGLTIATDATGYAAIAGDYRGESIVEIRAGGRSALTALDIGAPFEQGAYLLGERSIPMEVRTGAGAFIRRDIVRLNPADGLALLLRTEFPNIGGPGDSRTPFLELWSEADGLLREWPGTAFTRSATAYGTELGTDSNLLPQHPVLMATRVALRRDASNNLLQTTYGASAWLQCVFTPFGTSTVYVYRSRFAEAIFNPYRAWAQTSLLSTETGFFLPLFAFFFNAGSGFENRSPRPEGLFHGGATTDNNGYVLTRALLQHEGTVFVSCFKPGSPNESIVDFVPQGNAARLTGLDGANLRLHPASLLGTPIYRTE